MIYESDNAGTSELMLSSKNVARGADVSEAIVSVNFDASRYAPAVTSKDRSWGARIRTGISKQLQRLASFP